MLSNSVPPPNTAPSVDLDFARLEIEQAMETIRIQYSLLVRILTAFSIAVVTLIGLGITTKSAGVILVCCLFPVAGIYARARFNQLLIPIICTAVSIEDRYDTERIDGLATNFIANVVSPAFIKQIKAINKVDSFEERAKQIQKMPYPHILGTGRKSTHLLLAIAVFGHIVVPLILVLAFHWQMA